MVTLGAADDWSVATRTRHNKVVIALVGGMVAGTLALLAMVMSAECATLEAVAGDEGLARCLSWLRGTWPCST